jgi:uncharacterized protein (TIGR02118 family)
MISVYILYPKSDGSTFDMSHYTQTHMPMLAEALGESCKGWGVSAPVDKYHAIGWAMVDSHEAFNTAMAERGGPVMADIPNYTSAVPELIVGDIVV